jgi:hypothetical protein
VWRQRFAYIAGGTVEQKRVVFLSYYRFKLRVELSTIQEAQDAATRSANSNRSISESMILEGEPSHVERVGEREGELRQCAGCGNKIHDKYLLQVTFFPAYAGEISQACHECKSKILLALFKNF